MASTPLRSRRDKEPGQDAWLWLWLGYNSQWDLGQAMRLSFLTCLVRSLGHASIMSLYHLHRVMRTVSAPFPDPPPARLLSSAKFQLMDLRIFLLHLLKLLDIKIWVQKQLLAYMRARLGVERVIKNKNKKKEDEKFYQVRWPNVSHHSSTLKRTRPE